MISNSPGTALMPNPGERIAVLMAVDEQYVAPLFVTINSLVEHLHSQMGLDLYLMAPELSYKTYAVLDSAWGERVHLHRVLVNPVRFAPSLVGSAFFNSSTVHYRVMAVACLPPHVSKVLYLDADLLIQRDLFELWQQDLQGNVILAVQDSYIQSFPPYCRPRGTASKNALPYFNSGVMMIDREAWGTERLEERYLNALGEVHGRSRWPDQDALNICLVGRWGLLPPIWNKQFAIDLFADWRCSPYEEEEFLQARRGPAVIHYCTRTKPWHTFCDHPLQTVLDFQDHLRQTSLGDGMPDHASLLRRLLEYFEGPHRRLLDTMAIAVRARRKRHALKAMLPSMLRLLIRAPWLLFTVPLAILWKQAALWMK